MVNHAAIDIAVTAGTVDLTRLRTSAVTDLGAVAESCRWAGVEVTPVAADEVAAALRDCPEASSLLLRSIPQAADGARTYVARLQTRESLSTFRHRILRAMAGAVMGVPWVAAARTATVVLALADDEKAPGRVATEGGGR